MGRRSEGVVLALLVSTAALAEPAPQKCTVDGKPVTLVTTSASILNDVLSKAPQLGFDLRGTPRPSLTVTIALDKVANGATLTAINALPGTALQAAWLGEGDATKRYYLEKGTLTVVKYDLEAKQLELKFDFVMREGRAFEARKNTENPKLSVQCEVKTGVYDARKSPHGP